LAPAPRLSPAREDRHGGGIDSHIHLICPQLCDERFTAASRRCSAAAPARPRDRGNDLHAGTWHLARILQAAEGIPVNLGFFGKGNASEPKALVEMVESAPARQTARDWGTTRRDRLLLSVAEQLDIAVAIHTDTLNESGFVEDTIAAFKGRNIHAFHTEGAGGGTRPTSSSCAVCRTFCRHRRIRHGRSRSTRSTNISTC